MNSKLNPRGYPAAFIKIIKDSTPNMDAVNRQRLCKILFKDDFILLKDASAEGQFGVIPNDHKGGIVMAGIKETIERMDLAKMLDCTTHEAAAPATPVDREPMYSALRELKDKLGDAPVRLLVQATGAQKIHGIHDDFVGVTLDAAKQLLASGNKDDQLFVLRAHVKGYYHVWSEVFRDGLAAICYFYQNECVKRVEPLAAPEEVVTKVPTIAVASPEDAKQVKHYFDRKAERNAAHANSVIGRLQELKVKKAELLVMVANVSAQIAELDLQATKQTRDYYARKGVHHG